MTDAPSAEEESRWSEQEVAANAAWTDELRATNTIAAVETETGTFCETCERNITGEDGAAHDGHETFDFWFGFISDAFASFIGKHQQVFKHDDGSIMCACCESFDGPVYWRTHLAVVFRAFVLSAAGVSVLSQPGKDAK